ncbi:unnamed protein product [Penicillium salamii]|uniref:DUF2470 domain-containing protein n=1 Tax=Penicillium salamii TaxID=1612424 RepID=A0A9W4NEB7_9EURO|nr:unnamed protein product [Penicillium salamii]CAG8045571.1 unnamed protein product [Penicillium salamii]CAG8337653.1 unnamed protein product [Penicillium salamii]CAG8347065.1 unnamed protein product [Penicillium salamii]CAG8347071.1 unnamed protein product [Penicillium salamii]
MATIEKTKEQPKKLPVQDDLSDGEDYDSADDYTDEESEEEIPQAQKKKQLQRRKQPVQQDDDDEYTDEDDYDEYDYSDDSGDDAMQPYSKQNSSFKPNGGMDVLHKEEPSMLDQEGMKLRLELNLEIEVELKARIHGDLTLALISLYQLYKSQLLNLSLSLFLTIFLSFFLVSCTSLSSDSTMSSKDFIIKHMNADHQDSLVLFLRAYCGITSSQAKSAKLEDINLTNLIITAHGTRYSAPIEPPMKNYSEARSRMVAMHKESLRRLGRSDITLTEYRAPRGFPVVVFGLCLFFYVSCFQRSNLLPGSFVYEYFGYKFVPDLAHFFYNIQPWFFPLVVGIHVFETVLLIVTQLRPLGVPVLSALWCKWVASCLVEGFDTFQRIKQIVQEEREKKGKSQ